MISVILPDLLLQNKLVWYEFPVAFLNTLTNIPSALELQFFRFLINQADKEEVITNQQPIMDIISSSYRVSSWKNV